jgi:hypothetical protein
VPMAKRRPAIWRPAAHGYGAVGRGGARGGGTPVLGHGGGELTGARLPAVASVDWCDSPVKGQMGGRDEGLRDCRRCRRSGGAQGRVDGAGERLERATAGDTFMAVLERWHCDGGPLAWQLENEHGPTRRSWRLREAQDAALVAGSCSGTEETRGSDGAGRGT